MLPFDSPAYFPLLIKSLLRTPLQNAPDTEIVSDGLMRYSYRDFEGRLKRLAHALSSHGVGQGDVVAVMDWDTHRYFECFFAVPMMGAVLHTVNIRLAPAQIAYTIDHAEDDVILVHADFLPLMEEVMPLVKRDVRLILLRDDPAQSPESAFDFITSYDAMMAAPADDFVFPDFDERMRATTFYTTGTTGEPKAVAYSHRQLVLHTMGLLAGLGPIETSNRLHAGDVYMPITPMFHVHALGISLCGDPAWHQAGLCGSLYPGESAAVDRRGRSHLLALCADDPADAVVGAGSGGYGFVKAEDADWRIGIAAWAGRGGTGARHQCLYRIWHVGNLPGIDGFGA